MKGLITKTATADIERIFFTKNRGVRSTIIVSSIIMGFSMSPVSAEDSKWDPSIPDQFDQEAFTKELNDGEVTNKGQRSAQDGTSAIISVDSYGSRRFIDIVEITPANGPQYFLLDDGYGTPNLGGARTEGDLSERRNISKWRIGKW